MVLKNVKVLEPGLIQVQSFSNPGKWYVIDRWDKSCTCECFRIKGWCKHLRFIGENEALVRLKESMWKSERNFEEWRRNLVVGKLRKFKSLDGETVKKMERCGLEYDEDLSALVWALIT